MLLSCLLERLYLSELIDTEVSYGDFTSRKEYSSNWRSKKQRMVFENKFEFWLAVICITKHNFFYAVGNMKENQISFIFARLYCPHTIL